MILLHSIGQPAQPCPKCLVILDAAAQLLGSKPTPRRGDLSVCLQCGAVLSWDEKMSLREYTEKEVAVLPAIVQKELKRAQSFAAYVRRQCGRDDAKGN